MTDIVVVVAALQGAAKGCAVGALLGAGLSCCVMVGREGAIGCEAFQEDRELACCFTSAGGIIGGRWGALYATNEAY